MMYIINKILDINKISTMAMINPELLNYIIIVLLIIIIFLLGLTLFENRK